MIRKKFLKGIPFGAKNITYLPINLLSINPSQASLLNTKSR